MQSACEGVTAEVRKSEKCREAATTHAAHQRTFLRIKAIREYALVTEQVKLFVAFAIVRFLEYGYVIDAAFMQILVSMFSCIRLM